MESWPTIVEPSSSVQLSTTWPDSSALNLNWIYGLAETAVSKSAAKTCLPATRQTNLFRILRGTRLPSLSLRSPVSITCDTKAFTSTMSPFLTSFLSSLMRGCAAMIVSWRCCAMACSAAAAADRDLDLFARHEHRAVVHLGDRDHILRRSETDAGVGFGNAARRRAVERHHAGARVLVGDDHDVGDIGLFGHRAFNGHRHRHRVAVFRDLGEVELDLALNRDLAAGEFLDGVVGIVL